MRIKNNTALASKVSLAVILLLVGLTLFGCGVSSSPQGGSGGTIADDIIYICPTLRATSTGLSCSAPRLEGKLVAVKTSDGSLQPPFPLQAAAPSGGFGCAAPASASAVVYGSPAVDGDWVYVADYNGKVYAIHPKDLSSKTPVYLDPNNPQPIIGGPVVALGKAFLGCADGKVYALDATSLEPAWPQPFVTGGKIWATPVIDGDTLYIGSFDKKLYALNASDGTKKWEFSTKGSIISTALVCNNTVYISSFDRNLYAVDATDGSPKWKFTADRWFWAKPVVYNNVIYVGCLNHKVYALDAKTGNKINEYDLGSPLSSSPVLSDSLIVVASQEGRVYTIDTTNGQMKLLTDLGETIYAPPSASDSVVYVYTGSQNLYALSVESGAKLWSQIIK
jgi:outer membrane protein assembly factor BamB